MPPITIKQAQIETVSISARVIRIGKRQMTQAVFRQLELEQLYDSSIEKVKGVVWGRVNYFWDGCSHGYRGHEYSSLGDRVHLHILWQKGEELRRDCVPKPDTWVGNTEEDRVLHIQHVEFYKALLVAPQLFIAV